MKTSHYPHLTENSHTSSNNKKKTNWKEHFKADLDHEKQIPRLMVYNKGSQPKRKNHQFHRHNHHPQQQNSPTLNNYFKSTTKNYSKPTYRIINKLTKSLTPTSIIITAMKTKQAIKNSKNNNSTRSDDIKVRYLKHIGPIAIKHLTSLFNTAINTNTIPQIWEPAKIILIAKPNKNPSLPSSYQPIASLSPIAKTLEKIILPYITNNIALPTHQHGFRAAHYQHSTTPNQQHHNHWLQQKKTKDHPKRTRPHQSI